MVLRTPCLVALAFFASGTWVKAQERLRFGHLTAADGLSRNWVESVLKDHQGFLWVGTQDGLNRYDGRRFAVYRHDPEDPHSLPSSIASALYEDRSGRLWVGSGWGRAGLSLYDRELDRFDRIPYGPGSGGLSGSWVQAILEDHEGRHWVGTENGLNRMEPETGRFQAFPFEPRGPADDTSTVIFSLLEDRQGRLWLGTGSGLYRFDPPTGRYTAWEGRPDHPDGPDDADVWDVVEGPDGRLWVSTVGGGLFQVDPDTGSQRRFVPVHGDSTSLSHLRVRRLAWDHSGQLWVGTENGGLCRLDPQTGRFQRFLPDPEDPSSLNSASVWSLFVGDQDIIWIGTYNGGLNFLSPLPRGFDVVRSHRGGLSSPHVTAVMEDRKGNLWVGTDGGGLNRIDGTDGSYRHFRHDPLRPSTIGSDAVFGLLEDHAGQIWLGGWDAGLSRLDPQSGRVTRFQHDPADPTSIVSNNVWTVLELSSGELLLATDRGVDLMDRGLGTSSRLADRYPGAGVSATFTALEDPAGDLWLGGKVEGVQHVERATGRVTELRHDPGDPDSLGSGWVMALHRDSAGNLWFGTEGGLSCLEAGTKRMRRFTARDGLPSNGIASIEEGLSGDLWLGTFAGLTNLVNAVKVPRVPEILSFDVRDGLQGQEFAAGASCRTRPGLLLFGGEGGLSLFDPAEIAKNPTPPPVVFTDLRLAGERVVPGTPGGPLERALGETSELRLSYRETLITFEFAALNYILPEKNRFRYRLSGIDPTWNDGGSQGSATYTRIPPGRYSLHVQAANNDGVWNRQGASLLVVVTPPLWQTWWFRLAAVALLATAVVAGHKLRTRAIQARNRELQREIEDRRRAEAELELRNAELERYAYSVSHDLKSPLVTIRGFLGYLERAAADGDLEAVGRDVARITAATDRMHALLGELLELSRVGRDGSRHEPVSLRQLAEEARDSLAARIKERGAHVEVAPDLPTVPGDPVRLREVFQNLIENALTFTAAGTEPRVEIGSAVDDDQVVVYVRDNGIGIEPRHHELVFGLFNRLDASSQGTGIGLALVRRIIETHGGRVFVESAGVGRGSTFRFTLPQRADSP